MDTFVGFRLYLVKLVHPVVYSDDTQDVLKNSKELVKPLAIADQLLLCPVDVTGGVLSLATSLHSHSNRKRCGR